MNQVELRYNLATKVMRNGVEVIVATDRNLRPLEPEYLRLLSSTVTRPITLAPHTLSNLMSMVLPTDLINDSQSHFVSILQPTFTTRTYFTTYNYQTTVLKGNRTDVSNVQTTVTNVKTEQFSKSKSSSKDIQPTSVSLSSSPTFQTEVFHTTYTYLNTFLDGEQPLVMSSTQTVANTFTGIYGSELEPSEVFPTTNTYLKTVEFTKTLTDGTDYQIISTEDLVTQVVVTDKQGKKPSNFPITTDVTKTYFVTYTYFSTYIDGDQTKVKSDVSVSSDVTIEKFYIKPKKTETKTIEIRKTEAPAKLPSAPSPFTLLATRTYLTTFTYFTTLLQGPNSDKAETKINSRTKIVENTITETIPLEDLNTDYLMRLNGSLYKNTGNLVVTATLKRGEKIVVTAHKNPSLGSSYQKYEIKPTKTVLDSQTIFLQGNKNDQEDSKIKLSSVKSKSVIHKSKIKSTKTHINEITAEALIATQEIEPVSVTPTVTVTLTPALSTAVSQSVDATSESYSATPSPTSTVNSEKATILASEKVNLVKEESDQSSDASEPDSLKKKPTLKQPNNQMNVSNLLNLNSLGINGMNVLGPVFNAMAELIHNNLNKNADAMTRRNDTVAPLKETEQVVKKPTTNNINPLLSFVNKFTPATVKGASEPKVKVTTARTPVYIPVGSFAKDTEFEESQNSHVVLANRPDNWHEKWKDTQGKNFEKVRPNDTPITILEGGIPISPGQVITTNSDVIIGRPGESGPRPPTFAIKDNVPIDMKPPPLPPHALMQGEEEVDDFIGQHSTNQGVDFDFSKEEYNIIPSRPPLPPSKHLPHEPHSSKGGRPHFKGSSQHKNTHFGKHTLYDSGTMDLNPPPVPPPPPVRSHDVHRPITINHEQNDDSGQYKPPNNIPVLPVSNQNVENYIHPAAISPAVVGLPALPVLDQGLQENIHPIINEPTPSIDILNPNGILVIPTVAHIPLNLVPTQNSNTVDRSTGHQLLVNIQPSQVANIVIPHGSSTALILSDGKQHSLKGEVIDDPSPHPEPETVGFVGAEPVLKIEGEDITTTLHKEVPGKTIEGTKQGNRILFSNRPQLTTELIKIRPKPNFSDAKLQLHSASEHTQNLYIDHQQAGHQTIFGEHSLPSESPGLSAFIQNHRQTENKHRGEGDLQINQNHHVEGHTVLKGSGSVYLNSNRNIPPLDSIKGGAKEVYLNKNYRKHGQNINNGGANFFGSIKEHHNAQKLPGGVHYTQNLGHNSQNQYLGHNYQINGGGLYRDQIKFTQGTNLIKGGNGIYVDISPPGHLPPRPDINHLQESHSSIKHQSTISENLSNHQSGHVHDVPLNAQVQLGSGLKKENPLKEILISTNTNKHDSIYDEKEKDTKFSENHKRPVVDLPENLSPPPLPKDHRPQRPSFIGPHPSAPVQRHPPHPHPTIPEPADFMIPPPKTSHRPNHKPHVEVHHRPLIPIGAGAPQHSYPNPRPEDILIVPHKNKPGTSGSNFASDIKHEVHKHSSSIYSSSDLSEGNEPIKTEYGEEIQESISRPLFPGQLPAELQENTSFHNHKNIETTKHRPGVELHQSSTRTKVNTTKAENIGQKLPTRQESNSNTKNQNAGDLTNMSTHWSLANHQNHQAENNKQTSSNSATFFSLIKKPSGFVTSNKDEVSFNGNHKESSVGFNNHRETSNLANHKEISSLDSHKITVNNKKPEGSASGQETTPSETVVNTNSNIRIHAVGPNVLPSGFVRNENAVEHKRPSGNTSGSKSEGLQREPSTPFKNEVKTGFNKESTEYSSTDNKASSSGIVTTVKDKTPVTDQLNQHQKDKSKIPSGFHHPPDTNLKKQPDRYDINNNAYGTQTQTNHQQKFNIQTRPSKIPESAGTSSHTIKFDSNKVSVGHPSLNNGGNIPSRYPANGESGHTLKQTIKRPSGFTTPNKEDYNKQSGFPVKDNFPSSVGGTKKPPQKFSSPGGDDGHGKKKVPSGFISKNETGISFGVGSVHNYGNKTINFYEPKPTFGSNDERDVAYNNAESDADKWFASNFGGSNGNSNSDAKISTSNKLTTAVIHRNVSSAPNTVLPTGSDVRITLLTPPKMEDVKSKPEDVMGLSPPPLERPRRPQKPQRPKPPYKFEIPTTPKSTLTPIAIENDFPPVRSPDFNRKPLKPQDIFPPRLPDNFIHHVPEFPVRGHPKPRPQERPVTSLPIDVPSSSTTEKNYPIDYEENGDEDPFFAGSEINGHSKPIIDKEPILSSMRPPPPPPPAPPQLPTTSTISRPKPVIHPRPTTYQEPSKVRGEERPKPEKPPQIKQKTITSTERQEITPTSTVQSAIETTFHTKVSASVTPTAIQPHKEWQDADIIIGSETIFDPDQFSSHVTPTISIPTSKKNIVTTLISTGSTTIFGDLYTSGPKHVEDNSKSRTRPENSVKDTVEPEKTSISPTKTVLPVHTTTLTVTTTMTTVVHSVGHKPFTKTIVLTKTLLSTVVNKVTETKTLVKPTTATIIQTHTIATTKTALVVPTALYPTQTKYPSGGTLKPEIFMADPHAKETMTISVSSSMNKNKNGEEKRKPLGTRIEQSDKDSIVVVMSNKHPDINLSDADNDNIDVGGDDENGINDSRVVVGGVFEANEGKKYKEVECSPGCKAKRNELCQRIEGVMKCVCRPGFARMFPDRPCRPTYTYNVQLTLEKLGSEQITYEKNLAQSTSPNMAKLASATKEGLDRMIMQSELRDVYHGVMLNGFQGKEKKTMVDFYVQLSENTDEGKLMDIFKKTLQTSNYSLGGTELFAAREADSLNAEDFNECLNPKFHDCSENARCFNLKGTYTCSCKEGFVDLSENSQFPGRKCSDMIGCEYCGYHGACYSKGEGQITCECFQWYSGERCHINLKVLLIALVTIGAILLALLLVCAVLTCLNRRSRSSTASRTNGSSAGYLRYRGPSSQSLDRRAMIADSSSESSVDNLPYICPPPLPSAGTMSAKKKPVLRHTKGPAPRPIPPPGMEQRDRSVTVMIPRAKYRPMPPLSPHLTMSTFSPDKHLQKTAAQIATEQKLLSYLDGNTREDRNTANTTQNNRQTKEQQKNYEYKSSTTNANESPRPAEKKNESRVFEYEYKISNMLFTEETNSADKRSSKSLDDRFRRHSDSTQLQSDNSHKNMHFRKYSAGALVSAGYEVSAKVGMHHLEEDTTEDEQSAIINTHTMKSNRSQFTTLNRTGDHKTMSEARSYDETTVHPQTRSLKTHYSGSSPSSRVNNDEGHTMIERDLGSTFIMPESQLFKPEADRGSDISNFDSL